MNAKHLILIVAVTAAIAGGIWQLRTQEPQTTSKEQQRGTWLQGLNEKVNTIESIQIVKRDQTITLRRSTDQWRMVEKADYPVSIDKVREILLGLADLVIVEPKTLNPALYHKLGLDDIGKDASPATHIALKDGAGQLIAETILGNNRPSAGAPGLTEYYARDPNQAQSWLIRGRLHIPDRAIDWLDTTILDLDIKRVRALTLTHPDGETVVIEKTDPSQARYTLATPPGDASAPLDAVLDNTVSAASRLSFTDARAIKPQDSTLPSELSVSIETFDGATISFNILPGDVKYLTMNAAMKTEAASTEQAAPDDQKKDAPADQPSAADLTQELQKRGQKWAFAISPETAQSLIKRRADFIKKEEAAPATTSTEAATAPGAAHENTD